MLAQLEQPAQLRVRVILHPRYGFRSCEEAIIQAPERSIHDRTTEDSPTWQKRSRSGVSAGRPTPRVQYGNQAGPAAANTT